LVFSLGIDTNWQKLRTRGMTADWELRPKSAWNYGLKVSESAAQLSEVPHSAKSGKSIFSLEGSPLRVEVSGKRIPEWRTANGVADELPQSPTSNAEPIEKLVLCPYGAAKLRITVFPMVSG
jgi:hypothetical protein